ncbi:MAG: hypothetical protein GC181_08815 [Bacteroidetes bacterium]|nr:hypothetical protein [Bacteroidota bacterium]
MKNLIILLAALFIGQTLKSQNTSDTNTTMPHVQLSFLYPLGTSGTHSIRETQNVSINIIAGANKEIDGVEVGGVANFTKGSVNGVQIAGTANLVMDTLKGLQLAGTANVVMKDVQAAQGSGFANVTLGRHTGVQAAGFANYSGMKMQGAQISGFANVAMDSMAGIQVSGFANTSLHNTKGNQIAGYINVATETMDGLQIAGFSNVTTGSMEGLQISGFVNYAKKIKGAQLGFINVADTLHGIAIGFLSFAKNGYHTFEISSNETFQTNLTFKTGVNQFYNSLSAGVQWNGDKSVWAFGYGIGTRKMFGNLYSLSADLRTYGVLPDKFEDDHWQSFNKLELSFARRINKYVEVYAGGNVNMWFSDPDQSRPSYLRSTGNHGSGNDFNWVMYPGFQAGIRIF